MKNNFIFSALISSCLIAPFTANIIFDTRSLSLWFILSQIAFTIILVLSGSKITFLKMPLYFYCSFVGIFLFALFSGFYNSLELIPAVGMILAYFLVYANAATFLRVDKRLFNGVIRLLFIVLLILAVVSIAGRLSGISLPGLGLTNQEILLIGENSMFALFFAPVAILHGKLFGNQLRILAILVILAVTLPNAVMLIFCGIYSLILLFYSPMSLRKKTQIAWTILAFGFFAIVNQATYLSARFTVSAADMNLSSLIYAIHWIEVWEVVTQLKFLGDGVGEVTHILQHNEFVIKIAKIYGDDLVYGTGVNAGHFYISRLAGSIGYGFFLFLLLYVFSLIKSIKMTKRYLTNVPLSIFFLVTFIPELLFRTPSLMSFGLFWLMLGFCSLQLEKTEFRRGRVGDQYAK